LLGPCHVKKWPSQSKHLPPWTISIPAALPHPLQADQMSGSLQPSALQLFSSKVANFPMGRVQQQQRFKLLKVYSFSLFFLCFSLLFLFNLSEVNPTEWAQKSSHGASLMVFAKTYETNYTVPDIDVHLPSCPTVQHSVSAPASASASVSEPAAGPGSD